jgi:hypothetical protein
MTARLNAIFVPRRCSNLDVEAKSVNLRLRRSCNQSNDEWNRLCARHLILPIVIAQHLQDSSPDNKRRTSPAERCKATT